MHMGKWGSRGAKIHPGPHNNSVAELELGLKSPESQRFLSTSEMLKQELGLGPKLLHLQPLLGRQGHPWARDLLL